MLSTKDKFCLHISSYMMRTQLTWYIQELQHSLTQRKELHFTSRLAMQPQWVPKVRNAFKRSQLPFQSLLHHVLLPWKELCLKRNKFVWSMLTCIYIQTQCSSFLPLPLFFRLQVHSIYPERLFISFRIST